MVPFTLKNGESVLVKYASLVLTSKNESAVVVEKVLEYLTYKRLFEAGGREEIPDFGQRIPPEIVLELYVPLVPHFLKCIVVAMFTYKFSTGSCWQIT